MIPTPHIDAKSKDEIAATVLLPGDPLRAKYIADNFLEHVRLFNQSRNMLGYTGTYQGKAVSVMGSGMGMPSMGLYSYELMHYYDVKKLIRIGSCGSLQHHIKIRELIVALSASHDSSYAAQFQLQGTIAPTADFRLLQQVITLAEQRRLPHHVGNVLSSDVFYSDQADMHLAWAKMGTLAVEMEAAALYLNAARAGVQALCLLTVSDSLVTGEKLSTHEREQGFADMVELALEVAD